MNIPSPYQNLTKSAINKKQDYCFNRVKFLKVNSNNLMLLCFTIFDIDFSNNN